MVLEIWYVCFDFMEKNAKQIEFALSCTYSVFTYFRPYHIVACINRQVGVTKVAISIIAFFVSSITFGLVERVGARARHTKRLSALLPVGDAFATYNINEFEQITDMSMLDGQCWTNYDSF